jgi:hypothetical protein
MHMHIQARIHRWVIWWFYVGVVCGAVAVTNVLFLDLSRTQDRITLLISLLFWVLGGLVCYASEGIRIERPPQQPIRKDPAKVPELQEWHSASDFLFPGNRKSLLTSGRHRSTWD